MRTDDLLREIQALWSWVTHNKKEKINGESECSDECVDSGSTVYLEEEGEK